MNRKTIFFVILYGLSRNLNRQKGLLYPISLAHPVQLHTHSETKFGFPCLRFICVAVHFEGCRWNLLSNFLNYFQDISQFAYIYLYLGCFLSKNSLYIAYLTTEMQNSEVLFLEYKKCLERYTNCFCWLHQAVNEVEAIDQ